LQKREKKENKNYTHLVITRKKQSSTIFDIFFTFCYTLQIILFNIRDLINSKDITFVLAKLKQNILTLFKKLKTKHMAEFNEAKQKEAFKRIFANLSMRDVDVDTKGEKEIIKYVPEGNGMEQFREDLYSQIIEVCYRENQWRVDDIDAENLVNNDTTFKKLFNIMFVDLEHIVHPKK
jgi:hypothetical protein